MAGNKLIIVESPAKVKTIKKYLGSGYMVDASQGHVRDLPKSRLGIDVEKDFDVDYITIRGKGELLAQLRKEVKQADKIYLATDPDREGEAISWHLYHSLKLGDTDKKIYRISFNEITKKAITESLKNPREIDMKLVDAQQARRVLDRLVGYQISPILWVKVRRGLSAGRVQSVALRMICDRDAEIEAFVPQEYWTIEADLKKEKGTKTIKARYYGDTTDKKELRDEASCRKVEKEVEGKPFTVTEVKKGEKYRKAPLPFTTSSLQQEAGKALNLSISKTMSIAQQLYEGVSIKGMGTIALITYLRTDSTRISEDADKAAREYVAANFGQNYVNKYAQQGSTGKNIQDAHEAIRPTDVTLTPIMLKDLLPRDQFRLYQLIWRRFVASRMMPAYYETVSAKIQAGSQVFATSGSRRVFDGFMSVYVSDDDKAEKDQLPAALSEGEVLNLKEIKSEQHFTQPPAHYTESTLVKAMEEEGIGRPSTYSPTIATILGRHYVAKEKKNLYATELGQVVNNIMVDQFPDVADLQFTANMEKRLDDVAEGTTEWKDVIREFYPSFEEELKKAEKELEKVKVQDEVSDEICELCGRNMVIKYGPHGKFLACPGFPECKNTKPYLEKTGITCPKCGGEVLIKKTRKGRIYYGCEKNPECDYMSWQRPKQETPPSEE